MDIFFSLLIIAAAWFLIYIICFALKLDKRFNWTFGPLFLLMRTKKFNSFIKRVAKKYANFWRIIGNISIITGFICMFISLGLFLYTLIDFFLPDPVVTGEGAAVGLIIPGVTISFKTFLYLIIPLILTMIPHELAHGVVAHADGVELKSTGLVFFAVFFGAFVEPKEEDLMESSAHTKMRTFAAGIFPNLILGLLTIPLVVFSAQILSPFYHPADGVLVIEAVDDSPATDSGIARGTVMLDINNTHLSNAQDFSNYMQQTQPDELIIVNTTNELLTIRLASHPNNNSIGYLGVRTINYQEPKSAFPGKFFPYMYSQQVMWLMVIAFGAVLLNAIPVPMLLDGDKLLSSFLTSYIPNKRTAIIIQDIFRFTAIFLFITNLILPIVRNGFMRIG
ncbi:MAG: hypothetical protein EU542_08845 [Promethearchaeota archaeon]|nr:MAG: hypothetical protein EU542_08845 [Candidatus Lokiarchaeota archaeon]